MTSMQSDADFTASIDQFETSQLIYLKKSEEKSLFEDKGNANDLAVDVIKKLICIHNDKLVIKVMHIETMQCPTSVPKKVVIHNIALHQTEQGFKSWNHDHGKNTVKLYQAHDVSGWMDSDLKPVLVSMAKSHGKKDEDVTMWKFWKLVKLSLDTIIKTQLSQSMGLREQIMTGGKKKRKSSGGKKKLSAAKTKKNVTGGKKKNK